MAKMIF